MGASVADSKGGEFACQYCFRRGPRELHKGDGCELLSMCEQGRASKVIPEGGKKESRGSGGAGETSRSMVVENRIRW